MKEIVIPSSVTIIEEKAFNGCKSLCKVTFSQSLNEITLPSSLVSIEDHAFEKCKSLIKVTLPSSLISIGISAFSG